MLTWPLAAKRPSSAWTSSRVSISSCSPRQRAAARTASNCVMSSPSRRRGCSSVSVSTASVSGNRSSGSLRATRAEGSLAGADGSFPDAEGAAVSRASSALRRIADPRYTPSGVSSISSSEAACCHTPPGQRTRVSAIRTPGARKRTGSCTGSVEGASVAASSVVSSCSTTTSRRSISSLAKQNRLCHRQAGRSSVCTPASSTFSPSSVKRRFASCNSPARRPPA